MLEKYLVSLMANPPAVYNNFVVKIGNVFCIQHIGRVCGGVLRSLIFISSDC